MMQNQNEEAVVVKSIIVDRNIEYAFRIWTEHINGWWPKRHSISNDAQTQVAIESRVGGRFFERTSEGVEHDWGSVLVWEPPAHFAYLWYLGSGQQLPTRVDVNFTKLAENRTHVEIVHRGPELIGKLWGTNKTRYSSSWDNVLAGYVDFCQQRG